MCSSLADGGLRCLGHTEGPLKALKKEYSDGLKNDAIAAGIPASAEYLEEKTSEFEAAYIKEQSGHAAKQEDTRLAMLKAHEEATKAKEDLEKVGPDGELNEFRGLQTIARDLGGFVGNRAGRAVIALSEKFPNTFKVPETNADKVNQMVAAVNAKPGFSSFPEKEEYLETRQMMRLLNERGDNLYHQLNQAKADLTAQRVNELHVNDPVLRKLRSKADIESFVHTVSADREHNTKYAAALEEARAKHLVKAKDEDFPALTERIRKADNDYNNARVKMADLETRYHRHTKSGDASTYEINRMIDSAPSATEPVEHFQYKAKVREFNKTKESYVALANKEYNVDQAKSDYRKNLESSPATPRDKEQMKEFKTKVYDKKPEVVALKADIKEKAYHVSISSQNRSNIRSQASKAFHAGDMPTYTRLMDKVIKLDSLAEAQMGKNRLRALANNGVSQKAKESIRSQAASAPAHYRTNLSNS